MVVAVGVGSGEASLVLGHVSLASPVARDPAKREDFVCIFLLSGRVREEGGGGGAGGCLAAGEVLIRSFGVRSFVPRFWEITASLTLNRALGRAVALPDPESLRVQRESDRRRRSTASVQHVSGCCCAERGGGCGGLCITRDLGMATDKVVLVMVMNSIH
ncbi:hypothetical protein E2C01_020394 [Portunus trituberculatus]|uniref:Uncharacterized protein n=1 Tax=Portunus trituberculatus TaxID=210409 RepID=A0A5B7E1K0_PORTR|nr:hypothetical protein [Portunus trituberculatus]